MTVKYNIVERGTPGRPEAPKKYYPMIHSTGRVTTRELAQEASLISTLSTTDMMAAIESFLTIIPKELAKGNIVELGEFGTIWIRVESDGADTANSVQASQITNVLPRFSPGKLFKDVLARIEFAKNLQQPPQPEPEEG